MASLCVLATVENGEPRARTLVLRDIDAIIGSTGRDTPARSEPLANHANTGLGIFVNGTSPKCHEFRQTATVYVVVYLPSLKVQYRLRCRLEPLPGDVVRESWELRPSVPKRMDWLYEDLPQSAAVGSREELIDRLPGSDLQAAPASALGFLFTTDEVERLDLDRADGVHDRRLYRFEDARWVEVTLVP